MVYQNTKFKICLSLFGCEVNILPNVHIVQCDQSSQAKDGGADLRHQCNEKNPQPLKRCIRRPQLLPEIVENVLRSLWWVAGSEQPSPCLQTPEVGGLLGHLLLEQAALTALHFLSQIYMDFSQF